ncbi:MAG: S8 family serine peptidase [Acidobacteriota bacterium]
MSWGRRRKPIRRRTYSGDCEAIRWFQTKLPDAKNVQVAVLDTGIDKNHPDLAEVAVQYDYNGASATDILGHGTHVGGTIAALINNGIGVTGIANCRLLVWKIFGDAPAADGQYYVDGSMYLRALNAVRTSGARVLNLSIGGTASSQTEQLLFRRLESAGVSTIAAMGNKYEEGESDFVSRGLRDGAGCRGGIV